MKTEYQVSCVLTERENDILYAIYYNLSMGSVAEEARAALRKLMTESESARGLAKAFDIALDGESISLPTGV